MSKNQKNRRCNSTVAVLLLNHEIDVLSHPRLGEPGAREETWQTSTLTKDWTTAATVPGYNLTITRVNYYPSRLVQPLKSKPATARRMSAWWPALSNLTNQVASCHWLPMQWLLPKPQHVTRLPRQLTRPRCPRNLI